MRDNNSVLLGLGLLTLIILGAAFIVNLGSTFGTVFESTVQSPASVVLPTNTSVTNASVTSTSVTRKTPAQSEQIAGSSSLSTQILITQTVVELEQRFASIDYHWPPSNLREIPHVAVQQLPSDLASITNTAEKKNLFLRILLPLVLLENRRIHEQRSLMQLLFSRSLPFKGSPMGSWLIAMKKELRVHGDISNPEVQQRMLQRLDNIPPALALAQGAIESGWGTSRFALEGNSLFGQWTFQSGKGLEPNKRDPKANHFVASFPNLQASVRAYMRNLNTNRAYQEFRDSRAVLRAQGKPLDALGLAGHLHRYSQRGMDYVKELRIIIAGSSLALLNNLPLSISPGQLASVFGLAVQPPKPTQTPS